MRRVIASTLCYAACSAFAQGITPMEFEGTATMLAPQGVLTSCGLAFDGAKPFPARRTPEIEQVSGSIAIYTDGMTLVKAGHQIGFLKGEQVAIRHVGDRVAWIRIEGEAPLVPVAGQLIPGERPPFHLFAVNPAAAGKAISAILNGKTIWIGFEQAGTVKSIFSGRMKDDPAVTSQVRTCFSEWSKAPDATKKP